MEQLEFEIPELDRKKTQNAVEAALEKFRLFKTIEFEDREASITASYSERFHGRTNQTSDQTADIAIYNVDARAYRRSYCERIEKAVKRLHPRERLLIEERYMKEDYVYDYVVYSQIMNISEATYYKYRWRAFYKLAIMLKLAVIKASDKCSLEYNVLENKD